MRTTTVTSFVRAARSSSASASSVMAAKDIRLRGGGQTSQRRRCLRCQQKSTRSEQYYRPLNPPMPDAREGCPPSSGTGRNNVFARRQVLVFVKQSDSPITLAPRRDPHPRRSVQLPTVLAQRAPGSSTSNTRGGPWRRLFIRRAGDDSRAWMEPDVLGVVASDDGRLHSASDGLRWLPESE